MVGRSHDYLDLGSRHLFLLPPDHLLDVVQRYAKVADEPSLHAGWNVPVEPILVSVMELADGVVVQVWS